MKTANKESIARVIDYFRRHNGGELYPQSLALIRKCLNLGNDFSIFAASVGISNKYSAEPILDLLRIGAGEKPKTRKQQKPAGSNIYSLPGRIESLDPEAQIFFYKESS